MKTAKNWALGIFAGIALTLVSLGALVAHERRALADDGTGQDFVYHIPQLATDADQLTQMLSDLRLAILVGNYHGFNLRTVIPPIPATQDIVIFNLSGAGLSLEYPDGGVATLAGVPVVVYVDGGYVPPSGSAGAYFPGSVGVDAGFTSLNGSILDNGTTIANGATLTGGLTTDTVTASGLVKTYTYPVAAAPQQTAAVLIQSGTAAIGTATGYTFTTATPAGVAFSATPVCLCTDATGANAIKCVASTTACTPTGTTTDTFSWIAVGLK